MSWQEHEVDMEQWRLQYFRETRRRQPRRFPWSYLLVGLIVGAFVLAAVATLLPHCAAGVCR